jgi:hypothetical protein
LVDGDIKLHPKRFENITHMVEQYSWRIFPSIMVGTTNAYFYGEGKRIL